MIESLDAQNDRARIELFRATPSRPLRCIAVHPKEKGLAKHVEWFAKQ